MLTNTVLTIAVVTSLLSLNLSDEAWKQFAPILQALAMVISAAALWRANGAKKVGDRILEKTDAQTVTIEKAADAAAQAEKNTNGNLDKLREAYIQSAKEHSEQLATIAAVAAKPAPPTILVQPPAGGPPVAGGRRAADPKSE